MQITTEAEVQVTTPEECNWVVSLDDGGIVATHKTDGRQVALTWEMAMTAAWERYGSGTTPSARWKRRLPGSDEKMDRQRRPQSKS